VPLSVPLALTLGEAVAEGARVSVGDIGIVTVLHERMHQIERFREDFGG
jgi:hypothetical protein